MKVKVELEFDTDNVDDLAKIEEVLYYLQDIKEMLDSKQQNLNKNTKRKKSQNESVV